jgi:hypothetical protein
MPAACRTRARRRPACPGAARCWRGTWTPPWFPRWPPWPGAGGWCWWWRGMGGRPWPMGRGFTCRIAGRRRGCSRSCWRADPAGRAFSPSRRMGGRGWPGRGAWGRTSSFSPRCFPPPAIRVPGRWVRCAGRPWRGGPGGRWSPWGAWPRGTAGACRHGPGDGPRSGRSAGAGGTHTGCCLADTVFRACRVLAQCTMDGRKAPEP